MNFKNILPYHKHTVILKSLNKFHITYIHESFRLYRNQLFSRKKTTSSVVFTNLTHFAPNRVCNQ